MFPHMHVRGKDMTYRLLYPDGKTEIVLNVPKYDFNWQLGYDLAKPVRIPKGTKLLSIHDTIFPCKTHTPRLDRRSRRHHREPFRKRSDLLLLLIAQCYTLPVVLALVARKAFCVSS